MSTPDCTFAGVLNGGDICHQTFLFLKGNISLVVIRSVLSLRAFKHGSRTRVTSRIRVGESCVCAAISTIGLRSEASPFRGSMKTRPLSGSDHSPNRPCVPEQQASNCWPGYARKATWGLLRTRGILPRARRNGLSTGMNPSCATTVV